MRKVTFVDTRKLGKGISTHEHPPGMNCGERESGKRRRHVMGEGCNYRTRGSSRDELMGRKPGERQGIRTPYSPVQNVVSRARVGARVQAGQPLVPKKEVTINPINPRGKKCWLDPGRKSNVSLSIFIRLRPRLAGWVLITFPHGLLFFRIVFSGTFCRRNKTTFKLATKLGEASLGTN